MSDRESKILIDVTYIPCLSALKAHSKGELLKNTIKSEYEPFSTHQVLTGAARRNCTAHFLRLPAPKVSQDISFISKIRYVPPPQNLAGATKLRLKGTFCTPGG